MNVARSVLDLTDEDRMALVRYCARFTGDPEIAKDLAQQALLDAWRRQDELRDAGAFRSWLFSIARSTCLMWARRTTREHSLTITDDRLLTDCMGDTGADFTIALERAELTELLAEALALLPDATRDVLVGRYIHDLSQADLAARLGTSEGAIEARIQRGKAAMRAALSARAIERGDVPNGEETGWTETRLWCPGCGRRRLRGQLDAARGLLNLRCQDCELTDHNYIQAQMGDGLAGLRSFKPAVSRVLTSIHQMYRVDPHAGRTRCRGCGTLLAIQHDGHLFHTLTCDRCGFVDRETWHSLSWSLPEARAFWRHHPRMRFVPEQAIQFDGAPAVITGFESVTTGERLEIVAHASTLAILKVEGTPATVLADRPLQ